MSIIFDSIEHFRTHICIPPGKLRPDDPGFSLQEKFHGPQLELPNGVNVRAGTICLSVRSLNINAVNRLSADVTPVHNLGVTVSLDLSFDDIRSLGFRTGDPDSLYEICNTRPIMIWDQNTIRFLLLNLCILGHREHGLRMAVDSSKWLRFSNLTVKKDINLMSDWCLAATADTILGLYKGIACIRRGDPSLLDTNAIRTFFFPPQHNGHGFSWQP